MPESTPLPASPISRVLLGFVLAPLLPAFYAALFFAQPWAFPIGLCLSYPAALVFGVPLFFGFRRMAWLAWWQMSLCGMISAVPLVLLYWQLGAPPHLGAFDPLNAVVLEGWGGFTGLSFWLLAIAGTTPVNFRVLLGLGF
jgi:hypothetical protein